MTDIAPNLERLGLEQYLDAFVGEGFDTWEILLDIQESDFDALNVKLGHRRKLQRAIADYKGISYERLVGSPAQEALHEGGKGQEGNTSLSLSNERGSIPAPETKRKYRRHPKPDDNAPERPPSAYVIFSNKIREEIKDLNLSFTQIAKLVGDRWQKLDPLGKEPFEAQANAAKEKYNIQLSTYRKTDSYKDYMQYLSEFKAKHGQPSEQKRPRLEPESSGSIVSARSLEANPESASSHVRGGSMGSLASSPYIGPPTHSTGSLPSGAAPTRPPFPSSRSGSPPTSQQNREPFRPGLMSSHSSVSDESSTVRSELPDPLMRASALSLGSASGTPPLPPQSSASITLEPMGSPDMFARPRLAYYGPQYPPLATAIPTNIPTNPSNTHPPGASPSFPFPSPTTQDVAWRNRPVETRGFQDNPRVLQPSGPFIPGTHQMNPTYLPPLISADRLSELNQAGGPRSLPPPRGPSTAPPSLPYLGRALEQPRPFAGEPPSERHQLASGETRPRLQSPESDAANTLAGLASVVPRSEIAKPTSHSPPQPPTQPPP